MRLSLTKFFLMSSAPAPQGPLQPERLAEEPRVVNSSDLFDGRSEIRVKHRGDEYRLRITRQGKLILTK